MKRVSFFLIVVALIAGMVGCTEVPVVTLTITSTEGGEVTAPGEGTFTYNEGTIVNVVAEADDDYRFAKWTGNVSAMADIHDNETTITMNDSYSITANFEEPDPNTLFAGGNGTEENPYQIANWHHLYNIRDYLDNHFILINDLKSTTAGYGELAGSTANGGKGWQPIGTEDDSFTGTLDGQGYEIRDLLINRPDEDLVGLFGTVNEEGVIANTGLANATVTGNLRVGGLVGDTVGNVTECYATGSVTGDDWVGGLIGQGHGIVSNCYSGANVTGTWSVGGLMGANENIISNSYFTGSVTGGYSAGGLAGFHNYGTMSHSYSSGDITGNVSVGGLVGSTFYSTVNNCSAAGSVIGNEDVGGLIGNNYQGHVNNSYASGPVSGGEDVGGLVGSNNGYVNNSYATGILTGEESIGGLVGYNWRFLSNSYSTGNVTGSSAVGGLVGENRPAGEVSECLWDIETSGQATSDGGTGKTTAQMQDIATFSGATWDIIAVANPGIRNLAYNWNVVDDETYPFLSWEPVS